jgi:hypothetical protein
MFGIYIDYVCVYVHLEEKESLVVVKNKTWRWQ